MKILLQSAYKRNMPRRKISLKQKRRAISHDAIREEVQRVMEGSLNASFIPDFIESQIHAHLVSKLFEAVEAFPGIELYGHRVLLRVVPIVGADADEKLQ